MNNQLFYQFQCLTEKSTPLSGRAILQTWFKRADRRYIAEALQKFKVYNKDVFDFLAVTPIVEGSGNETTLSFRSDHYIGAIPLRAPDTGKQIGDLVVVPRYQTARDKYVDYFGIVNLLQEHYPPEFKTTIPLLTKNNIRPPIYLEAAKYIDLLEQGLRSHWHKFVNTKTSYAYPKPNVDWQEYTRQSSNPQKGLLYPSRANLLSMYHAGIFELKYVYELAKHEILSVRTPINIRISTKQKIARMDSMLHIYKAYQINTLVIHHADPLIIKKVKQQGNKILRESGEDTPAWRINFAILFERYVQHIFRKVSDEIGARQFDNYKIHRSQGRYPQWSLRYLEPDIFIDKGYYNIIVDAKYKSHLYNYQSVSESLRESHREDLHQVLAYAAFTSSANKLGFLCYPYDRLYASEIDYVSNLANTKTKLILLGIPLSVAELPTVQHTVRTIISDYERTIS